MQGPQIVYPDRSRTQSILQLTAMLQGSLRGLGQVGDAIARARARREAREFQKREDSRRQERHEIGMEQAGEQRGAFEQFKGMFEQKLQPDLTPQFEPGPQMEPPADLELDMEPRFPEASPQDRIQAFVGALSQAPGAAGDQRIQGLRQALELGAGPTEYQRLRLAAQGERTDVAKAGEERKLKDTDLARLSEVANSKVGFGLTALSMQNIEPEEFLARANEMMDKGFSAPGVAPSAATTKMFQGLMEKFEGKATDAAEARIRQNLTEIADERKVPWLVTLLGSEKLAERRGAARVLSAEAKATGESEYLVPVVLGAMTDYFQLLKTGDAAVLDVKKGTAELKTALDEQKTAFAKEQWIYNVLMKSWKKTYIEGTGGRRVYNSWQVNFKGLDEKVLYRAIASVVRIVSKEK